MKEEILKTKDRVLADLKKIRNIKELEALEIKFLGRRGSLTKILRSIADLRQEQKKEIGSLGNMVKTEITGAISKTREMLQAKEGKDFVDVTLPGRKIPAGHLHPLTSLLNELEDLFSTMGFMILDGPELESDYYNFEALNIPPFHPARDIQDTFYIEPIGENGAKEKKSGYDMLMRTHTSPVQVRAMQKYGAPLRCVVPGRVFRCEATDACHDSTFYQLEGLMIDQGIAVSHLISVIKEMLSGIFKQEVQIRVRPGYFPFVEPGIEADVRCTLCHGSGCSSCKNEGWLEMLGAGMVHPRVLQYGGIDPQKYSGFAFGLGVDRLLMMNNAVNDIRLLHSGDLRFIKQF